MADLQFVSLDEIPKQQLIDLMNNRAVARYLPLLTTTFTQDSCEAFLKAKRDLWKRHGFGPWAFLINGQFAGWGGLQPEEGEADFALVLHPDFWGWGLKIFRKIKHQAFEEMGLSSITALLPPERHNKKSIHRLGFIKDNELLIDSTPFVQYRLTAP